MLFKSIVDRTQTQLAYNSIYGRWSEIKDTPATDLIVWRKRQIYHKCRLSEFIDETKEHLLIVNKNTKSTAYASVQKWRIVWVNNNIPTQIEWDKKTEGYFVNVDFRVTKTEGRIAQFSF